MIGKLLCKLGFHKEVEDTRGIYPLDPSLDLIGYKCERCGRFGDFGKLELRKK